MALEQLGYDVLLTCWFNFCNIRTFGLLDAKVYVGSTPIQNAIVFSRDTDNGQRISVPCIDGTYDATIDTTTLYKTDVSGATGSQRYLLHNWSRSVAGVIKSDWRTLLTNANTRRITALGYSIKSNQLDVDMTNGGTNTIPLYCESDTNVTLSENDAVAKLASSFSVNSGTNTITVTANSTLDDLYDAMKAFKTRAVTAQLEYPTIATQPVNASGTNLVTAMSVVGIEFLTTGTKFKTLQANVTANAAFSNISIIGDVNQDIPTDLSGVTISGTLTYNTNTDTTITIIDTNINTVENIGTEIITINKVNSTIDNYTDAEINFLDSNLSAVGITSATIYGSQSDRDTGANAWATFTASLDFKYGSVVSGVTMQNTVYLRVVVGSVTLFAQITLVTGSNVLDLGVQGQLSAINAKVDLTAKEATILQTETDIISEINANEVKIDAIKTKTDLLTFTAGNINAIANVVEDKTGYALTALEREAIAVVVESHLLDEGDSQMLINAIVGAIGNQNIDEITLVAAIRSDIERVGGKLDNVTINLPKINRNVIKASKIIPANETF